MNNLGRGSAHLDLLCCEERREDRQTKEWPKAALYKLCIPTELCTVWCQHSMYICSAEVSSLTHRCRTAQSGVHWGPIHAILYILLYGKFYVLIQSQGSPCMQAHLA